MSSCRRFRFVVPLLAGALVALLTVGAVALRPGSVTGAAEAAASVPAGPVAPEVPDGSALGPGRLPPCGPAVAALSPRDRLAQRLVVGVDAADPGKVVETVRATQVGGVFLGGNATALLRDQALRRVQAVARLPVAVSVDDEGGRVQRVDALDGRLPGARRMAGWYTPEQVRDLARERGRALAVRGVTVNFAPAVDVGNQPANAVIGDRAFSGDPAVVSRYAGAFADGLRDAGILPVLKHFPGHGRADGDSHRGRVTTPPLAQLRVADLLPYADLMRVGPVAVMVGHLDVPGLTDDLPSSLTPGTYSLLRDDFGFDGLVMTDDLGAMKAVAGTFALPDAVVRALAAGADQALWSSGTKDAASVAAVLETAEAALAEGRLDPGTNDRAVARILAAKHVCT
jgi:beta-N-acetylhexosaminidase